MSRSYKKTPIIRYEKEDYHILNRKIRHDKDAEFSTPGAFKRHIPHFNEWESLWTKERAIEEWNSNVHCAQDNFDSLEEYLDYWKHCVVRK